MNDQDAWIVRNAALLALLGTDDGGRRRERRLEAARHELEGLEVR